MLKYFTVVIKYFTVMIKYFTVMIKYKGGPIPFSSEICTFFLYLS